MEIRGTPRYLARRVPIGKPKVPNKAALKDSSEPATKMLLSAPLAKSLEREKKVSNECFRMVAKLVLPLQNRNRSSTKQRWDISA